MKRAVLCVMMVLLLAVVAYARTFKNEPDGFRGILWDTNIKSLDNMTHVGTDASYGGIEIYERVGDSLEVGGAKLKSVQYGFWQDRFSNAIMSVEGQVNWEALKDALFMKFGKGYQSNEYIERFVWFGDKTGIYAQYNEFSKEGGVFFSSTEIMAEQEAYDKQKAKEGAASGF